MPSLLQCTPSPYANLENETEGGRVTLLLCARLNIGSISPVILLRRELTGTAVKNQLLLPESPWPPSLIEKARQSEAKVVLHALKMFMTSAEQVRTPACMFTLYASACVCAQPFKTECTTTSQVSSRASY